MSESYIQLPTDSTGKKARSIQRTVGENSVQDEVVEVARATDGTIIDPVEKTQLPAALTAGGNLKAAVQEALPAGTNNIGDVDVASLPTLPAGSNIIGKVGIDQTTPGTTNRVATAHDSKTYESVTFDSSSSGNLKAAVASKVTKLHALAIQAQGTVIVNLNNGSGGARLMQWSFQAREGAALAFVPAPAYWLKTSVNTALYVTLSAAVVVTITAIVSSDDAS